MHGERSCSLAPPFEIESDRTSSPQFRLSWTHRKIVFLWRMTMVCKTGGGISGLQPTSKCPLPQFGSIWDIEWLMHIPILGTGQKSCMLSEKCSRKQGHPKLNPNSHNWDTQSNKITQFPPPLSPILQLCTLHRQPWFNTLTFDRQEHLLRLFGVSLQVTASCGIPSWKRKAKQRRQEHEMQSEMQDNWKSKTLL